MGKLSAIYERNKKWLYFSLVATFIWGLAAHGYCFFDNSVSHDSLNEFHAAIFGNDWKISLGRIFVPLYRDLFRSDVTLPWLIGLLSLLWIGLSVFFVVKIFDMDSKLMVFLTAGVFATNISVAAVAATYINDLDSNMLALLCAVVAVYLWRKVRYGAVLGTVFIMASLGIYQSYIMVAIVLVMIACILDLLREERFQKVFAQGLKAIGMLLAGGFLYYVAMKAVLAFTGNALTSGDYNSLDQAMKLNPANFLRLTVEAYQDCFYRLMTVYSSYPSIMMKGITLLLFAVAAIAILVWLCSKKIGIAEKTLGLVLIALLPFGMNVIYVLTIGESHDLMVFSIWLFYLLVLLLADWLVKQWQPVKKKFQAASLIRLVSMVLVFAISYGSVQFDNGMYMKKDLEFDAYLSLMTRIVYRMEDQEGYIPGETPVVFVGLPDNKNDMIPGFREYWNVIGVISTDVIMAPERSRFQAYFDYILNTPLLLAEGDVWIETLESQLVREMPAYPAQNCITMHDGVLIVKLGETGESDTE